MNKKQMFGNMIALARRAPLANMDEAEAVARQLQEFAQYAKQELDKDEADEELPPGGIPGE
jgi:hypothetical protein